MRILERLGAIVHAIAVTAACLLIPAQIIVSLFYVIGRKFFHVPSTSLQELEWHFFFALVFLTLGGALLADRHVRVDILRQRLSNHALAKIEIVGFVVALLPFCLAVTYFGTIAAWDSFLVGERAHAARGLPWRWIIKSIVPLGCFLLLLAGMVVTARNIALLRGTANDAVSPVASPGGLP